MAGNRDIFPEDGQLQHLIALVSEAVAAVVYAILFDDCYNKETDPQKKMQIAEGFVATAEGNVATDRYISDVAENILNEIKSNPATIVDNINSTEEGKFLSSTIGAPSSKE